MASRLPFITFLFHARLRERAAVSSFTGIAGLVLMLGSVAPTGALGATLTLSNFTSPSAGQPGITLVNVTGSGFPAGGIPPGNVTVSLWNPVSKTGATALATSLATIAGPVMRVTFLIPASITVSSPTAYQVSISGTNAGGVAFSSGNSASLTIDPAPQILSVSPTFGTTGQTVSVTVTAQFTNFTPGVTQVSFGPGISVGGAPEGAFGPVTVNSLTSFTASLSIDPAASQRTQTFSVSTGSQQASMANGFALFRPVLLDASGKHLISGAGGSPVFLTGDAAWELFVQLSNTDIETYLTNRQSLGFNALIISLADNIYQTNAPSDYYGNVPFDGADFTNEDPTYWARIDYLLQRMIAHGMIAFLDPAFVGLDPNAGYYTSYLNSSDATLTAYGTWLANRYASYPNVVWALGGDIPQSAFYPKVADIAAGIRAVDTSHLITVEGIPQAIAGQNGSSSVEDFCASTCPAWLNLNWVYNQYQSVQGACAYNYANYSLPSFIGETWYELEHGLTELQVRHEGWWGILSGCRLGYFFGNNAIWTFGGPADSSGFTWQSQLSSVDSIAQSYLGELFRSREFWMLVPDSTNTYLTGGYGSGTNLSVLARTSDGQTMIAYVPNDNGNPTTITVNMAGITSSSGMVHGWWFNPQTAATTDLGTFANSGSQHFTTPDQNDWVLVLDDNSAALAAPGT